MLKPSATITSTQVSQASGSGGPSLWDKAFDSLAPDLKSTLGQATADKHNILDAVLEAAEKQKTTSLRKRWKYKRSNGEVVIIRDVIEKIAKWVERFIAVGDTAVQFDPDKAALPWAAVRFLLQVTVNDIQQYTAMIQDLEIVSRIIARYKEFENLHLGQGHPTESALQTALTVFYAEVLAYLSKAIAFFSQSMTIRLAKSFLWSADEGIATVLSREDEILKLAGLQDTSSLRFIETTVLRVKDQINNNVRRVQEENAIKMVTWLSSSPFPIHHDTIVQSRTPEFGKWILKHPVYEAWCDSSSSSTLWIHGITGSGKTHLFSVVVDTLLAERDLKPSSTPFAYFYCLENDSEPERSSAEGILRSILRQLTITESQSDVRDFLYADFERRSRSARLQALDLPRLTRKDCVDRIIQVADEDPITILLDSVDQVQEESRSFLLDSLIEIISKAANVVKLLLASRNSLDVQSVMPTLKEIIITPDLVRDDMSRFITQKINEAKLISGRLSLKARDSLTEALLNGAGEMFLWAHRQIQQLRRIKNEDDLLPAFKSSILSDLDKLYDNDLKQVLCSGDTSRSLVVRIFSWLLYMKAPLSIEALLAAILTSSTEIPSFTAADISTLCSDLVVVDTQNQVVRLAHHSIREYILRAHQPLFSATAAHTLLASTCIKSSSLGPPGTGSLSLQVRDFYFYAAMYWAGHFESSKAFDPEHTLFQEMTSFIFEDDENDVSLSFEAWMDICKEISDLLPRDHEMKPVIGAIPNESSSPLFLAAIFGIDRLLPYLDEAETATDWDQRNTIGHTAVYLAASFGHLSTVAALIERGVELNVECGGYGSPLYVACFRGHTEIVSKLLQHDASPKCGTKFKSAVHAAIHGGYEDIVVSLIQHASTITCEEDYEQAIQMAAEYGFLKVIEELKKPTFKPYINNETPDKHKMRLAKAIKGGQLFVLQRQLSKGETEASTVFPNDAVAIASLYGHYDIVKYLLDQGLDIEAKGQFGTPLRSASLMNHRSTVEELLLAGANVNACERNGNALYAAAIKGNVDIVRILLEEGADVNQETGSFETVLAAASYFGHRSVVEMLLDAGALVFSPFSYRDAFNAAAEGGHEEIILLFLDRGFRFNPNREPTAPMNRIIVHREVSPCRVGRPEHTSRGKRRMKQEVAEAPVEMQVDDTATSVLSDDQLDMVFDGLHNGERAPRSPRYTGRDKVPLGLCALQISAARGNEEVINVLLTQKDTAKMYEGSITRALYQAASNGHFGSFRLLLDRLTTKKSFLQYFESHLIELFAWWPAKTVAPSFKQEIFQCALLKAAQLGFEEAKIDSFRLQLPPGREKYKVVSVEHDVLRADFWKCCKSGQWYELEDIMQSEHQHLLQDEDILKGIEIAAKDGGAPCLEIIFKHRSELRHHSIPGETLVCAAGKDLETLKFLGPRQCDMPYPPDILGQMTYSACKRGLPEVIDYLVSDFGVDINEPVPDQDTSASAFPRYRFVPVRGRRPSEISDSSGYSDSPEATESPGLPDRSASQENLDSPGPSDRLHSLPRDSDTPEVSDSSEYSDFSYDEGYPGSSQRETTINEEFQSVSPLQLALSIFRYDEKFRYPGDPEFNDISEHEKVIQRLLSLGADYNALGGMEHAPLQYAVKHCSDVVVRLLLSAGADLNIGSEAGSILVEAAQGESETMAIISSLFDAGHRPPDYGGEGEQIIEMLLKRFKDYSKRPELSGSSYHSRDDALFDDLSIQHIFDQGTGAALEFFLTRYETGKLVDARYNVVLQMACLVGKMSLIELLLAREVDVNATSYYYGTSLQAAARTGQTDIVRLLLEHGADANIVQGRWDTPLRAAIRDGHYEVVELLLHHGALPRPDQEGKEQSSSPLQLAIRDQYTDIAKLLVAANPRFIDEQGNLPHPLILCCQKGDATMADLLLHAGASPNVYTCHDSWLGLDSSDASPLHAAVLGGYHDLVGKLLSKGADVNLNVDEALYETPLLAAVSTRDPGMVRLLLDGGADVHAPVNGHHKSLGPKPALQMIGEYIEDYKRFSRSKMTEDVESIKDLLEVYS